MKLLSSSSSCSSTTASSSSSLPHTLSTAGSVLSPGKKRGVWHPRPASRSGRFRTSSLTVKTSSNAAPRLYEAPDNPIPDLHQFQILVALVVIWMNLISNWFIFKMYSVSSSLVKDYTVIPQKKTFLKGLKWNLSSNWTAYSVAPANKCNVVILGTKKKLTSLPEMQLTKYNLLQSNIKLFYL